MNYYYLKLKNNIVKCIIHFKGWTTDGKHPACTVDVNECDLKHPKCSVNPPVPCINVPGSFYCGSCPHGTFFKINYD